MFINREAAYNYYFSPYPTTKHNKNINEEEENPSSYHKDNTCNENRIMKFDDGVYFYKIAFFGIIFNLFFLDTEVVKSIRLK